MKTRRLTVVSAGLSQPSSTRMLADRLATATVRALTNQGVTAEVETIELRDHAHDIANNLLTGFPAEELRHTLDSVQAADGLIAVSPIFTASYSGLFKSFFDVLDDGALAGKPVLIGATGGTERHSLALEHALRPLFAYLHAVVVPTAVYASSSDWASSADGSRLADRVDRAGGELADLIAGRPAQRPTDPFEEPTPFTELLLGQQR